MWKTIRNFVLFFIINFGALGLGSFLMGSSPIENSWYQSLNLAPWTPPGWVFGAAWTTIMLLFSVYMTVVFKENPTRSNKIIYAIHLLLNIGWNPVFFQMHLIFPGLIVLAALFLVLLVTHNKNFGWYNWKTLLITPYLVWLCIAFSLNLYTLIYN
jgi:benzodiazapine receptor